MSKLIRNIAVIGDGGWGTTLGIYLAKKGYSVKLWGPFPQYVRLLNKKRVSRQVRYFMEILDEHGWMERMIESWGQTKNQEIKKTRNQ